MKRHQIDHSLTEQEMADKNWTPNSIGEKWTISTRNDNTFGKMYVVERREIPICSSVSHCDSEHVRFILEKAQAGFDRVWKGLLDTISAKDCRIKSLEQDIVFMEKKLSRYENNPPSA